MTRMKQEPTAKDEFYPFPVYVPIAIDKKLTFVRKPASKRVAVKTGGDPLAEVVDFKAVIIT